MRSTSFFIPLVLACSVQGMLLFLWPSPFPVWLVETVPLSCFAGVTEIKPAVGVNSKGEGRLLPSDQNFLELEEKKGGRQGSRDTYGCVH